MSAPQGTPGDVRSRVWLSPQVLLVRRADAGKRPCRRGSLLQPHPSTRAQTLRGAGSRLWHSEEGLWAP